jgi:hypothetical protein
MILTGLRFYFISEVTDTVLFVIDVQTGENIL